MDVMLAIASVFLISTSGVSISSFFATFSAIIGMIAVLAKIVYDYATIKSRLSSSEVTMKSVEKKLDDNLEKISNSLEKLSNIISDHERRLTIIETNHQANHGGQK